eukprot:2495285-Prorocentrum_lima.AAC.1
MGIHRGSTSGLSTSSGPICWSDRSGCFRVMPRCCIRASEPFVWNHLCTICIADGFHSRSGCCRAQMYMIAQFT